MSDNYDFNWDIPFDVNDNALDLAPVTNGCAFDFSFLDNLQATEPEFDFLGLLPDADVDMQNLKPPVIRQYTASEAEGLTINPTWTTHRISNAEGIWNGPSESEKTSLESQAATAEPCERIPPSTSPYRCAVCSASIIIDRRFHIHCRDESHAGFVCSLPDCQQGVYSAEELEYHDRYFHISGEHYPVGNVSRLTCTEYCDNFHNLSEMQRHANEKQHSPFACTCGVRFVRQDALHRHIDSFAKTEPQFPCKICKFHRGRLGFRRRDHLVQHLQGYHKFDSEEIEQACPSSRKTKIRAWPTCPHQGCDFWRDPTFWALPWAQQEREKPFARQSDLTKHLKEVHKKTPFPCDVPECDRVGAKGYIREKDLMRHRIAKHPEAAEYIARGVATSGFNCQVPGCGKSYASVLTLQDHHVRKHYSPEDMKAYFDRY